MKALKDKIIGLDTMVFIYHIEDYPDYSTITEGLFKDIERGHLKAITSIITILEILVKPKKEGNFNAVTDYRDLIMSFPNLNVFDVDLNVADKASDLRAKYGLRTPDAIQIATALLGGATSFITNDEELKRVTDLKIIILSDLL